VQFRHAGLTPGHGPASRIGSGGLAKEQDAGRSAVRADELERGVVADRQVVAIALTRSSRASGSPGYVTIPGRTGTLTSMISMCL
jgi:hypothetical protein